MRLDPQPPPTIHLRRADELTAWVYEAVVYGGAPVSVDAQAIESVRASRAALLAHLDTGVVCYGVTTGMGALSKLDLTAEQRAALPRQTLIGRASGTGPPLPAAVGRGALLAKLAQFLGGHSGVSAELCEILADRLNRRLTPMIPSRGFGMAGEIIPLAHAMQTLIGEGRVLVAGEAIEEGDVGDMCVTGGEESAAAGAIEPAASWHRRQGVEPYEPGPKEGLSLISGTAVGPALAWDHGRRIERVVALAGEISAASIEALAAPLQPYSPDAASLNADPQVAEVAAGLREHLAGSHVHRQIRQAPVSFRAIPQVHAVADTALDRLRAAALAEMRSNGDNPAFFADPDSPAHGRLVNSGNFHGAALTAAVEALTAALVHVGVLSEKRLHRLLDERASGLAPQLAADPGLDGGLVTVHKAAVAYGACLRMLAAPASVMQPDTSFGQEDIVSMAFPALERLAEACSLVEAILAHELYAACVAIDQRGEQPGDDVDALRRLVRAEVGPYEGDRSYGPDLDLMIGLVQRRCAPAK